MTGMWFNTDTGPTVGRPHPTCIEVTSPADLVDGRQSWLCGIDCLPIPDETSPRWSESPDACRPVVRADRAGPYAQDRGIERWEWYYRCSIHDTSQAATGGTWGEALDLAAEHQREWALP
jgi:hypothetical protein